MQSRHSIGEDWELCRQFFEAASQGVDVAEFLKTVTTLFHQFTGSDVTEISLLRRSKYLVCRCEGVPDEIQAELVTKSDQIPGLAELVEKHLQREVASDRGSTPSDPPRGGLVFNLGESVQAGDLRETWSRFSEPGISFLVIPLRGEPRQGLMVFSSRSAGFFSTARVESLERLAEMLDTALASRDAQAALRERVKELTCLYQIALSIEEPHCSLHEVLQSIVDALPAAWLHPEDVWVRLSVDADIYAAGKPPIDGDRLRSTVAVMGRPRGLLEVGYSVSRPVLDEGPFLSEERRLLDTIAREVALIIERKEIVDNSRKLQEQLLHAERLATIGEFSASIAHELNEPLASILGFAQLASKCENLPSQAAGDLEKITKAVLHAREVLQQLLLFARRLPSKQEPLDLNDVTRASLSFLRGLFVEKGITLSESLDPQLPIVVGDLGQLRQVVVNLVANAVQAMPRGGNLTISTVWEKVAGVVCLGVKDSGVGMTEEVLEKAFIPFFTTRGESQGGTGLGLSVVHGIVTAHGGTIQVQSCPGQGTQFEIRIPVKRKTQGSN